MREDMGILVDGTVLDDVLAAVTDIHHLTEAAVEEENLDIERPALHVLIETIEIRIVLHLLVMGIPVEMLGQESRQGRLARAYVASYCDMHNTLVLG